MPYGSRVSKGIGMIVLRRLNGLLLGCRLKKATEINWALDNRKSPAQFGRDIEILPSLVLDTEPARQWWTKVQLEPSTLMPEAPSRMPSLHQRIVSAPQSHTVKSPKFGGETR
jgi:hypothetical protein